MYDPYCGIYDTSDFKAYELCCGCGGGSVQNVDESQIDMMCRPSDYRTVASDPSF